MTIGRLLGVERVSALSVLLFLLVCLQNDSNPAEMSWNEMEKKPGRTHDFVKLLYPWKVDVCMVTENTFRVSR